MAGPGDAAALLALKENLDRETSLVLREPGERSGNEEDVAADLGRVAGTINSVVIPAESAGQLAGYVDARGGRFRRNRITAHAVIGVLAAASGHGIGSGLLRELERWARAHEIHWLELTVMAHNLQARQLYMSAWASPWKVVAASTSSSAGIWSTSCTWPSCSRALLTEPPQRAVRPIRGGPTWSTGPWPMSSALLDSLTGQLVRAVEEARMAVPEVASRQRWLGARLALLAGEKELTRRRDAVNAQGAQAADGPGLEERRVRRPAGTGHARRAVRRRQPDGRPAHHVWRRLGRRLPVRHEVQQRNHRLASREVALPKIEACRAGQGWTVPWYFCYGSGFDYDLRVTLDEPIPQLHCNYRPEPGLADGGRSCELPCVSCFLRHGGELVHTRFEFLRGSTWLDTIQLGYPAWRCC